MFLKIFNIFFCLAFIACAVVQYNDPDPYLWMPLYLYGAVLCGLAAAKRFYPKAYLAGMLVYLIYAVYLFFTQDGVLDWIGQHQAENIASTMKATKPWIEDTREFFGLILLTGALLVNYIASKKR